MQTRKKVFGGLICAIAAFGISASAYAQTIEITDPETGKTQISSLKEFFVNGWSAVGIIASCSNYVPYGMSPCDLLNSNHSIRLELLADRKAARIPAVISVTPSVVRQDYFGSHQVELSIPLLNDARYNFAFLQSERQGGKINFVEMTANVHARVVRVRLIAMFSNSVLKKHAKSLCDSNFEMRRGTLAYSTHELRQMEDKIYECIDDSKLAKAQEVFEQLVTAARKGKPVILRGEFSNEQRISLKRFLDSGQQPIEWIFHVNEVVSEPARKMRAMEEPAKEPTDAAGKSVTPQQRAVPPWSFTPYGGFGGSEPANSPASE